MLQVINIKKVYNTGSIETKALENISIAFRQKEFVAILGISGSGKTTFLNIIGGLDHYDSGDLIIKGKHTSDFKEEAWDAYRNNSVGFVFQEYNLITHLSVIANVELGMALSGVSAKEKHRRALKVLEQVGLKEHIHKKPNQLSGGQMQRVAIARALANDPEILLCDEPTGALDTTTSSQIMDLVKDVAKYRLVIMVTHNTAIAEQYAERIIRFEDGRIVSDSNPYEKTSDSESFRLKKTSMSFLTALQLSFNNLRTKKGRTALTAFASSIGIIGIAVILSISTGFQKKVDAFERDALSEFPVIVSQSAMTVDTEEIKTLQSEMMDKAMGAGEFAESDEVFLYDPANNKILHTNVFTDEYMDYLDNIEPEICRSISYIRTVAMNMLRKVNEDIFPVYINNKLTPFSGEKVSMLDMSNRSNMGTMGLSSYPRELKKSAESYLEKNYDLLSGEYPQSVTDLVLVIDTKNRVDFNILKNLGFEFDGVDSIKFSDIVGTEFKIISNDDYYTKTEFGTFLPGTDYKAMYNSDRNVTVKISGIVRQKNGVGMALLASGIAYSDDLPRMIIEKESQSAIVMAQKESNKNVITMENIDEKTKTSIVSFLGGSRAPYMFMIYPENFENKDKVISFLNAYNEGKTKSNQIICTDLAGTISKMTSGIMNGITIVLIAFAAISLIVSLIMISIITYTSVLERTKEIGILRSLGARKKDIARLFDAETCILGVISGILGVVLAGLLTIPINYILYNLTGLKNVANLKINHALILAMVSTVLTILGGHIPAKIASKKDAVEALRSE